MGQIISFSEFSDYYRKLERKEEFVKGAIFDTNILIGLTYEVKNSHDELVKFFEENIAPIQENGFRLFTTVTTRSEYLDFYRRLIMTEHLRDAVDGKTSTKLPSEAKSKIQYQSGLLKKREQGGSDPVFSDTQIKEIKSKFSAGRFSGHDGWLALCEQTLKNRLDEVESELKSLGIEYISQHEQTQKSLFSKYIDWPEAKRISEATCLGLSDAMILNAFQCSRFPFVVSADFDIGYAVLASENTKDVVMPDDVAEKYKHYHF